MTETVIQRIQVTALTLLVVGLVGLTWQLSQSGFHIVSDLRDALPEVSPIESHVADNMHENLGQKVLFAIFSTDVTTLVKLADGIRSEVAASGVLKIDDAQVDFVDDYIEFMKETRFTLLGDKDREYLARGQFDLYENLVANFLYGIPDEPGWLPFSQDPFNLLGRFLSSLLPGKSIEVFDDYMFVSSGATRALVFSLSPITRADDMENTFAIQTFISGLALRLEEKEPSVEVVASGAVFHLAHAVRNARMEMSVFSTVSVLVVLFLYISVFRSLASLAFGLGSIAFGCWVALTVTGWWFAELHILTVVYGASLIGVGIDYSLHFLCMGEPKKIRTLRVASAVALMSTGIAYCFLTGAGFSLLKQMATFSVVGLASCWLFVTTLYPILFSQRSKIYSARFTALSRWLAKLWCERSRRQFVVGLGCLITVSVLTQVSLLSVNQTVSSLFKPDEGLVSNDQRVLALLDVMPVGRYFVVFDDTVQGVIERSEQFGKKFLKKWQHDGKLDEYQLLSDFLPSRRVQVENKKLIGQVYGVQGVAFNMAGLSDDAEVSIKVAFNAEQPLSDRRTVEVAEALFPHLWHGELDGNFVVSIPVKWCDLDKCRALKDAVEAGHVNPGKNVEYFDTTESWESALSDAAVRAILTLVVALWVISASLLAWTRRPDSLMIVIVPVVSALMVVATLALLGLEISLFHLFGIYLVIGLGFDYGIFIYWNRFDDVGCFVAVLLSALTTLAAFGLLSQSGSPMISAFGLTILIGTLFNILLVPGIRLFGGGATNAV